MTPFFNNVRTSVPNMAPKWFFYKAIIISFENLGMQKFEKNYWTRIWLIRMTPFLTGSKLLYQIWPIK